MEEVNLYIETNLKGPRRKEGKYIYLLECLTSKGTQTRDARGTIDQATENQLTVTALDEGLKRLLRPVRLTIWLDCEYVAGALRNGWPQKWEKDGWVNSKGKTVADAEKWQSVLGKIRIHEIEVKTGERHEYASWMKAELEKMESCTGATERGKNV